MTLAEILQQQQSTLLNRWRDRILESYPEDARAFFRRKNRFGNPVGAALDAQLGTLFSILTSGEASADDGALQDEWIKVRAVQGYSPSQALNFIPLLKPVLREALGPDLHNESLSAELSFMEARLDRLLLAAFDRYMEAREKLHEIRAGEWRRQNYLALRRNAAPDTSPLSFDAPENAEEP